MTGHEEPGPQDGAECDEVPYWLEATLDDVGDFDFEGPIAESEMANCDGLNTVYREAADFHERLGDEAAAPAARVFAMLSAVTSFHFKPNDRNAPFGAMMIMEGRRSPIPDDFRGQPVAVLSDVAVRATNPVLKARLCDVCWLLERKRHELGRAAVGAYVDIVEGLDSGKLKDRLERDDPVLGLASRDALKRALTIGHVFGSDAAEVKRAREWLVAARARAIADGNPVPVHWFFEMDLDFGVSDPGKLACEIDAFLVSQNSRAKSHTVVDLWRLAARAYRVVKGQDGENRCRIAAAEALVTESEQHASAMLASHWLSDAIAEYHGIPGTRERRTELRHKLIDVQAGIPDEMFSFSHPIGLKDIVEQVKAQLEEQTELIDLLFLFADLSHAPQPEQLTAEAIQSINDHPLSSLFAASFHDHEGKVIHRTGGGGFGDGEHGDASQTQIAQHERIRREIDVAGALGLARQHIKERHYIGEDVFHALLRHSPFVPHHLLRTYSIGFTRFFEGDYTSALYILTPMLENSLRHVLKTSGRDVTNFDDASQTQQDRTISVLFEQMRTEMEAIFGKAIIADIERVFSSKPGPSIRHDVAHGLLNDASPYGSDAIYGCWLIFRLCCIPLFSHREQIELPS